MLIDTFIFFNELDVLEVRLETLAPHVDRFVLVEADTTFQGKPKPLYFAENKQRFAKFADKIIHVVVEDMPIDGVPFDREYFQRDAIRRGLEGLPPETWILLSDVDEIPRLPFHRSFEQQDRALLFRQRLFYYAFDNECVNLPWLGTVLTRLDRLGRPSELRRSIVEQHGVLLGGGTNAGQFEIVEDGGWHFSFIGDASNAITKIESFAHDEYNSASFKDITSVQTAMRDGRDLFGRELRFAPAPLATLPDYVRAHAGEYEKRRLLRLEGGPAAADVNELLFDQYSRYAACALVLRQSGLTTGKTLLDVGSGPECWLGQFAKEAAITYLDPLIAAPASDRIKGDPLSPALPGRSFDFVCSVDVLEHVPAEARSAFLAKVAELAREGIVLGFPSLELPEAVRTDDAVDASYRAAFGIEYPWLAEHAQYGLPSAEATVEELRRAGWHCIRIGHGHAPWLQKMLPFIIEMWESDAFKEIARDLSRRFNAELAAGDFRPPFYREFVIATRQPLQSIQLPSGPDPLQADAAFERLMEEGRRKILVSAFRSMRDAEEAKQRASEALDAQKRESEVQIQGLREQVQVLDARLQAKEQELHHLLSSHSWSVTRPMRFAARLARYGLTAEDRGQLGKRARTIYHALPLPDSTRRVVSRAWYRWRTAALAAPLPRHPWHAPLERPAPREGAGRDWFFWGVIDWHFRQQRPQHLARAVARSGERVFYISAEVVPDPRPGFRIEPIDASGRLFQVKLHVVGVPAIYDDAPAPAALDQLRKSAGELLAWADAGPAVSVVQHPFWLDIAAVLPNSRLVYDCMDHHEGFGNNDAGILALERELFHVSDLVVVTSAWLQDHTATSGVPSVIVRNAGDYQHFRTPPANVYRDPQGRRIIGYYGAIAQWFDEPLVEAIARRFPQDLVLLVGNDTVGAGKRIGKLPNVAFVGEVPYAELPRYLHAFDVCLLPFQVIPLTLATNPVKIYEYLSAGKPVVSVDLPEIRQFGDLVAVASTTPDFTEAVARALDSGGTGEERLRRQAFAEQQTWEHRALEFREAVEQRAIRGPSASVIVVTYNNLELTRACLESLQALTDYEPVEVIVVDNASADGTPAFLREWAAQEPDRRIILNDDNKGFAAANNQGLAIARGEFLVLLNNDTYVTPGWLRGLVRHLRRDPRIGLLGPVTNNIGNEAKIDIAYADMPAMQAASAAYTRRHLGELVPMRTVAFFCVAMPRSVYETVGPLDEAFGRGFFEDDDYCRRVEAAGLLVACADDVFVHHHLSASFNKLGRPERQQLFDQNKAQYEAKWGPWTPHAYRKERTTLPPPPLPSATPAPTQQGTNSMQGQCCICGKHTRFTYDDPAVWRESLTCKHCLSTSRYRSIARGILQAVQDISGVQADSLAALRRKSGDRRLSVYDTQPPFYYAPCAYPLPDMLKRAGWFDVALSQYKPDLPLGQPLAEGVTNQNLECLTFADGSLDLVVTSDVMEHVRLDEKAHREIHRVLRQGGVYVFTVPHDMEMENTFVRVAVRDPDDASADEMLAEPEYHGDVNGDGSGALSYRVYGRDLLRTLDAIGFDVQYSRSDLPAQGIMSTELFYCRKR
jgi:O-antigen biosynthesis protein